MTAKSLKHKFLSSVADGTDATLVRPSNWNDDHDLWEGYRVFSTAGPDTIVHADHLSLIVYSNAGAVVANLAAPSGGNMPLGWRVRVRSAGVGGVTVTGTSGATFNGSATFALATGDVVDIHSTGANDYVAVAHKSGGGAAAVQVSVQKFTASGSYVPSANLISAIVECVGGGAGGGGIAAQANNGWAGGGGSGGFSRRYLTAAAIGASQAITIGSGGNGGASGANNGTDGTATSFGTLCVANGGGGGRGNTGSGTTPTGGGGTPASISGAVGDVIAGGQPGAGGGYTSTIFQGGNGASSAFGGGAVAPIFGGGSLTGNNASNYGAGGSGAFGQGSGAAAAGGNGSPGICLVTEFIGVPAPVTNAAVVLSTQTASASASLVFTLPAGYSRYKLFLDRMVAATAAQILLLQLSEDGGTTWKTAATYSNQATYGTGTTATGFQALTDAGVRPFIGLDLSGSTINASEMTIVPRPAGQITEIFHVGMAVAAGTLYSLNGFGYWQTATVAPNNAVRLIFSSGNITSGTATLYGWP